MEDLFKRFVVDFGEVEKYGFDRANDGFVLERNILNNSFLVKIEITSEGVISYKVFDKDFGEEYVNYKFEEQHGEFVDKIREELRKVLLDVRKACFSERLFLVQQANRISDLIYKRYGNQAEFLWESSPNFGVFRNGSSKKWYAIIMNIKRSKIDSGNDEVEIINIKLDSKKIPLFLERKGFYKAYHMNKKNWISILLDGSVSDGEIMELVGESYELSR